MSQQITLSVPEETLLALKLTAEQLGAEVRLASAVKLYELGRLSPARPQPSRVFRTWYF